MEKKIAIKGDNKNGSKIIELLKSLGGSNRWDFIGQRLDAFYYIDINNEIDNVDNSKTLKEKGYKIYNSFEVYEKSLTINYQDI